MVIEQRKKGIKGDRRRRGGRQCQEAAAWMVSQKVKCTLFTMYFTKVRNKAVLREY